MQNADSKDLGMSWVQQMLILDGAETSSPHEDKVIIEKSLGEVSLMEQDTIENVS